MNTKMKYKLSKYNQYYQNDRNLLLLGGVSRAIIEFENTTEDSLLDKIHALSAEEQNYLREFNIIIPENMDEYKDYLKKFEIWRSTSKDLTVTLGMTFACNFACKYCIQKENYTEHNSINREEADIIIGWVENAIDYLLPNIECLNINYFGGEPTLNLKMIYYMSEQFAILCEKKKISFYQQIVTNGYALDKQKIKRLQTLGLNDYQITLDGLADVHNSRRSRTFDSFSKIIENIIHIANNDMHIFLLHVFDMSNNDSAIDLVDYFSMLAKQQPLLKKAITFNFVPTIPKRVKSVECNKYIDGNEIVLSGLAVKAFSYAVQKGFSMANFLDIGHCFRQAKNTLLISPVMDLYKCYGTFGKKQYSIGNILDMGFAEFLDRAEPMSKANGFSNKCKQCDVVPFCRGGCQFSASELNGGKYGETWCERESIIESIHGYMKYRLLR